MREFSSYGPVDPRFHYCVERRELVERCVEQLVGRPGEGGHYFTIWAPRQTGKTWVMRRAIDEIRAHHGDRFVTGWISMQGAILEEDDPPEALLKYLPDMFRDAFGVRIEPLSDWADVKRLFSRADGVFGDKPLILLIDEFDSLPPLLIDRLVTIFRDIYLTRESFILHGLALVGVRAVLGVDSPRGSPFNVQRSLHVPNLTHAEVVDLFRQYQNESGQRIDSDVVDTVFEVTRGQPGLVSWFGELLTDQYKYNKNPKAPITMTNWEDVYTAACAIEPNNTVLNLIKKARGEYRRRVTELFTRPDVPFSFDDEGCNYLYLHGIIDHEQIVDATGKSLQVCRFSSPFIQLRLYNALTRDLFDDRMVALPLEPLDDLADVFSPAGLDAPALLRRYTSYLHRVEAMGMNPWDGQPRRHDLHLSEAVGHFHLYAWLKDAVGRICVVSPEFPTGNGKVDLLLRWQGRVGLIEVKSFRAKHELPMTRTQAARYAKSQGLGVATVALFVPTRDESILQALSGEEIVDEVRITTMAIGWG